MAGRPRKPTALRIHEGKRAHRPLNESEPQPAAGAPRIAPGLPPIAKRLWLAIVPELDRLNLLTLVDSAALEGACRGYAQGCAADRQIEKLQKRCASEKAEQQDFYRLSIMNSVSKKGWQQWKVFCTEFGLTPASRSRLTGTVEDSGARPAAGNKKVSFIERGLCG